MEITWFNALWVAGLLSMPVVAILALRRRIPHAMGIDTSAAAPISRPLGSIRVSGLCGLQVHRMIVTWPIVRIVLADDGILLSLPLDCSTFIPFASVKDLRTHRTQSLWSVVRLASTMEATIDHTCASIGSPVRIGLVGNRGEMLADALRTAWLQARSDAK